jgi:hypothetical protein
MPDVEQHQGEGQTRTGPSDSRKDLLDRTSEPSGCGNPNFAPIGSGNHEGSTVFEKSEHRKTRNQRNQPMPAPAKVPVIFGGP